MDVSLPPQNISQVRSFLELAGFYHPFAKDFDTIVAAMSELTKKEIPFKLGKIQEKAFPELKAKLTSATFLALLDFGKYFQIECDASVLGIGGVWMQKGRPLYILVRK